MRVCGVGYLGYRAYIIGNGRIDPCSRPSDALLQYLRLIASYSKHQAAEGHAESTYLEECAGLRI